MFKPRRSKELIIIIYRIALKRQMKELQLLPTIDSPQAVLTLLPAKTVKIQKITSVEAFKKSGLDFSKLRKGVLLDGKMVVLSKN
jgi:hypothetical protein